MIVHVTRDFPPRVAGGISTAVGGLVRATAEPDCAAVISFDGYRPKTRSPAPPAALAEHGHGAAVLRVTHPAHEGGAREWARRFEPHLVVCHHDLLWNTAQGLGAPRTATVTHVLQRAQNRLRGLADTLSARAQDAAIADADAVLAPSRWAAAELGRDYPDAAVRVAPLGIEAREPTATERRAIVLAGRFADVRGLGEVIGMLSVLAEACPGAELVVVGGCPENPRAERRWRERIAATGVPVTVTGWLDPDAVWWWLCKARIALVPSWIETFGMAAAEAMLAGAAVVASDVGALRELIDDGSTGILCPVRSPAPWIDAVAALWSAPERASLIGAEAHRRARDLVWEVRADTWRRIFDELAPGSVSQPARGALH